MGGALTDSRNIRSAMGYHGGVLYNPIMTVMREKLKYASVYVDQYSLDVN